MVIITNYFTEIRPRPVHPLVPVDDFTGGCSIRGWLVADNRVVVPWVGFEIYGTLRGISTCEALRPYGCLFTNPYATHPIRLTDRGIPLKEPNREHVKA